MADVPKLSAFSTLASGIAADATSMSVQSGHGARFPDTSTEGAFNVCIYDSRYKNFDVAYRAGMGEVVRVTSRSSDAFTITRAQEGTTALAFNTTGRTYRVEQNITPIYLTARDLPSQTNNAGKKLTTSGTATSWGYAWSAISTPLSQTAAGPNTTRYVSFDTGAAGASEANAEFIVFPLGGIIQNFIVYLTGNAGITSYVCTLRVNAEDQISVSAAVNSTTRNTSDTASFNAGDRISIKIVAGANGGFTPTLHGFSFNVAFTE